MLFTNLVRILRGLFIATALVLSVFVLIGNVTEADPLNSIYFLKINTTDLTASLRPKPLNDWYTVGLWGYCRGRAGSSHPIECTPAQAAFQFNPVEVFGYNTSTGKSLLNPHLPRDGTALDKYQDAYNWLFAAYIGSIVTNGLALLSTGNEKSPRNRYVVASVFSALAVVFAIGGAATAQILFSKLAYYINHNMLRHGSGLGSLHASLGTIDSIFAWVAAGTTAAAFPLSIFLLVTWRPEPPKEESDLPVKRQPYVPKPEDRSVFRTRIAVTPNPLQYTMSNY